MDFLEWYDYSSQMVRFDYTPFPSDSPKYGVNPMTEIHDFNTGVKYIINQRYRNCTPQVIDPTGFDADEVNPQTVRIRKPSQFFDLDSSFQYEGKHRSLGVDCDGWVGKETNFPPGVNSSVMEWLMTTNEWMISAGNGYEASIPRHMEISATDGSDLHFIYNIFNFDHSEPAGWEYDITDCFPGEHRRHLQFKLPGSFHKVLKMQKTRFEYALYKAITARAAISPVRLSHLQVDYDETGILVTFTVLDVAPIAGDVAKAATETPLDVAVQTLLAAVKNKQLTVTVPQNPEPWVLTAVPESGKELRVREWLNGPKPPPAQGYRPGDMAAVGVVMGILGAVAGCGVIIVIYRKNGGSFRRREKAEEFPMPKSEHQ